VGGLKKDALQILKNV